MAVRPCHGENKLLAAERFCPVEAEGAVLYPRGSWSYAPPHEPETWGDRPFLRPLAVFRGMRCTPARRTGGRCSAAISISAAARSSIRSGTAAPARTSGTPSTVCCGGARRLSRGAAWSTAPFPLTEKKQAVSALILAGDVLCAASSLGSLCLLDARSGAVVERLQAPPAAWDGLAAAHGRVFLSSEDGRLVCLEGSRAEPPPSAGDAHAQASSKSAGPRWQRARRDADFPLGKRGGPGTGPHSRRLVYDGRQPRRQPRAARAQGRNQSTVPPGQGPGRAGAVAGGNAATIRAFSAARDFRSIA